MGIKKNRNKTQPRIDKFPTEFFAAPKYKATKFPKIKAESFEEN